MGGRLSNRFLFTDEELRTLHHRMHTTLRMQMPAYTADEIEAHINNNRAIRSVLRPIKSGYPSRIMWPTLLERFFQVAHTAYDTALRCGTSEAKARRSALVCIQVPLEKYLGIAPDYSISGRQLTYLEDIWLRPPRRIAKR